MGFKVRSVLPAPLTSILFAACATTLSAENIVMFDEPTFANSINARGDVAGCFSDTWRKYKGCFVRDFHGHYTVFDTWNAYGINNRGDVAGTYFVRDRDGSISFFSIPNALWVGRVYINVRGDITGSFTDAYSLTHGFVKKRNGELSIFDPPCSKAAVVAGINASGEIAGTFTDAAALTSRGFIRDAKGNITVIDAPSARSTDVGGINASGEIAGSADRAGENARIFVRDRNGSFTFFDPPANSVGLTVVGINASGEVAGSYNDRSNPFRISGFVMDAGGRYTILNRAGWGRAWAESINDNGDVAGTVRLGTYEIHGFVRYANPRE